MIRWIEVLLPNGLCVYTKLSSKAIHRIHLHKESFVKVDLHKALIICYKALTNDYLAHHNK